MTDIIQELRGLIAEATPGPWECDGAVLEYEGARFGEVAYVIGKAGQQFPAKAANAALIVAAINHLPALLDRLEAAERVIDFLDMRRPINGIERRSKEEVFAIMADRIRLAEAGHYRLPAIREVRP